MNTLGIPKDLYPQIINHINLSHDLIDLVTLSRVSSNWMDAVTRWHQLQYGKSLSERGVE